MADENIPQPQPQTQPQFAENAELERAKAWWKKNGRAIVVGVGLGLGSVAGYNYWQSYQQTQAENASLLFGKLQDAVAAAAIDAETKTEPSNDTDTENQNHLADPIAAPIRTLAEDLMSDYRTTPYATNAALLLAKAAVESDALAQAAQALQWILDNSDDNGMQHIARLRLASVLLAQEQSQAALALLTVEDQGGFSARYHELTGDAHLQAGDIDSARSAYQRGLDRLPPTSDEHALLKLKRDNLGS